MNLTKKVQAAILQHAKSTTDEICGFVLQVGKAQDYLPCTNVSALPKEMFEISPEDWIVAEGRGEILAIVHSHPNGEPFLSGADRVSQHQSQLPWVLVTNGEIKTFRYAPLLRGRVFKYGEMDCFTLVRDAYMLAGIEFRDHPRTEIDADTALNSFVRNLPDGGFLQTTELQAGDVILTSRGGQPSHVALYIGRGEILHHAYDQLSRREPYRDAWRKLTHSIWRHKDWHPDMIEAVKSDMENVLDTQL